MPGRRPAGPAGPAGPGKRLSDRDRERLVSLLRRHFDDGRLDVDGLAARLEVVLRATTTADAAPCFDDLPPLPSPAGEAAAAGPPLPEPPRRHRGKRYGEPTRSGPPAGSGWQPTSEVFRDPASGQVMRVWVDPTDNGARHYLPELPDQT
ncbi:MAG: DUF1707 SHOCT-like domain-containing protein [Acidimicrobiales bacterium]